MPRTSDARPRRLLRNRRSDLGEPFVDLLLGLVFGDAVAFLDSTGKLVTPSFGPVQVVVGQLAPGLLRVAFELLPVAFDAIPIHGVVPGAACRAVVEEESG